MNICNSYLYFISCFKLCERDSHGCTPFLTAIMMHNLRGADLILEAVKRDGKNEAKHPTPVGKIHFCKLYISKLVKVKSFYHFYLYSMSHI